MTTSRRTVLTALAAAPALVGAGSSLAQAASTGDTYPSNTAMYADSSLVEGTDYGRRYRRHAMEDNSLTDRYDFGRTTVIAPHGGGIETGTSELCLAIAGYHPADLSVTPAGGPVHDYWMFEALRSSDNGVMHVTSIHCDDTVARSLCAGSLNVLSLHGCTPSQAGLEAGARAVLVGGLNTTLKQYLLGAFKTAGIRAVDAVGEEELAGVSPQNIVNRTLLGMGAQLEITTDLRAAMFGVNTRAGRKTSTTQVFWDFVAAVRTAIQRMEAEQRIA
ncbi:MULTISPECIES: poly-gamma-glutamate hydrolase family protein [unclassified Streptomyces]|uniref:poly-gamma-glutamate hydrolase family protein n=1 Tax=unclassified Streptomyces TaxID=2593676 RepID=UPI0035D5B1C4